MSRSTLRFGRRLLSLAPVAMPVGLSVCRGVRVTVRVSDLNVVDKLGQASVPGQEVSAT